MDNGNNDISVSWETLNKTVAVVNDSNKMLEDFLAVGDFSSENSLQEYIGVMKSSSERLTKLTDLYCAYSKGDLSADQYMESLNELNEA